MAPAAKLGNCVCRKCQNTNADVFDAVQAMCTGRDSVWHPAYAASLVKSLCVVRWSRRSIADGDESWQSDLRHCHYVTGAGAAADAESIAVDVY